MIRASMKILIVEDNLDLSQWLSRALRQHGYSVDCVASGEDADYVLKSENYSLVLLDLNLPKMPGGEVLRRLRARADHTPVLVLTANSSLQSRVGELDQGADDYLSKPFEMEELEARIRTLLRRSTGQTQPWLQCGDIRYDTNTRVFMQGSETMILTPRERAVLEVLFRSSGNTVSKKTLAQSVFSLDDDASADAIEIYVYRVRKKLESSTVRILTLRGLGYLLREAPDGN
jgi:two-component system response regulator TctD